MKESDHPVVEILCPGCEGHTEIEGFTPLDRNRLVLALTCLNCERGGDCVINLDDFYRIPDSPNGYL